MKQYIVVHLPVKLTNPNENTVPVEDIVDCLQLRKQLFFNLSEKTKIKGEVAPISASINDYISDKDGQHLGVVTKNIIFQTNADLFLSNSPFSYIQPLSHQIRNQQKHQVFQKDIDQENTDWCINQGDPIPQLNTALLTQEHTFFKNIFDKRPVMPMSLVQYINMQNLQYSNYKIQIILRQIAYQYTQGLYRKLWIRRGFAVNKFSYLNLQVKSTFYDKMQCDVLYKRMNKQQFEQFQVLYPRIAEQAKLLFDARQAKFATYLQAHDYQIYKQMITDESKQNLSFNLFLAELKQKIKVQEQEFYNNLLKILQIQQGDQNMELINMDDMYEDNLQGFDIDFQQNNNDQPNKQQNNANVEEEEEEEVE